MTDLIKEGIYHIDGAVSKKPEDSDGPARCSFIDLADGEKKVFYLGVQTISVAEYFALIIALSDAIRKRYGSIKIYTDSQLVYEQINHNLIHKDGKWKVKAEHLKGLFLVAENLLDLFFDWEIIKIRSNENKADLK